MNNKQRVFFNMEVPPATNMESLIHTLGKIMQIRNVAGQLPSTSDQIPPGLDHPIEESRKALEYDVLRFSNTLRNMTLMGTLEVVSAKTDNRMLTLIMEYEEVPPNVVTVE